MNPQALGYLLTKSKKSRGLRKHFWSAILLLFGVGSLMGFDQVKALLSKVLNGGIQIPAIIKPLLGQSQGPIHVYFTTPEKPADAPENPAKQLVGYIDGTKQTLDVCAFELDNQIITDALVRAHQRGVRVRMAIETDYDKEVGVQTLARLGVPIIGDGRSPLMHNKFMVFDNQAVWTGSMNFTENCAYKNNNNGMYIQNAELAANYSTKFSWMFDSLKFGGAPSKAAKIPNPVVKLADGTTIENYFSTHDHIADHVIETLGQAKQSIHFMAFSFTHNGIGQAMLTKAKAGVQVQGVFEKTQASGLYTEYAKFRHAGQEVYLDANPRNMHHKVIVIDGEIVVAGSFNFSDGADKDNDENVVIIRNKDVAKQFEEEFQRVFGAARKAETGR